jgi:hypothetical protein
MKKAAHDVVVIPFRPRTDELTFSHLDQFFLDSLEDLSGSRIQGIHPDFVFFFYLA